jgi:hypothetical protein
MFLVLIVNIMKTPLWYFSWVFYTTYFLYVRNELIWSECIVINILCELPMECPLTDNVRLISTCPRAKARLTNTILTMLESNLGAADLDPRVLGHVTPLDLIFFFAFAPVFDPLKVGD